MADRMTIDELKSYLWQSAVLLRTNIDAGAYKQYIFPLMFFKRICDVYDEETEKAIAEYGEDIDLYPEEELHSFLVPKGYHWKDVRQVTEDVGTAIVTAFREIEKINGDRMTGIFGDGAWTNKNRLPDRLLRDLLEHFSSKNLSLANCPEDELGQGYEYLIKQFADDSGHTAQEFYTNRTVVHLMTEILQPQSGESVYDPTCGSAGMLISCIAHLKALGKEWRNLQIYGQEINQLTSAIGRMNLFLHGINDFHIANDDTLKSPVFIEAGQLQKFDLVLANPPYSISQWDRTAFESDKYGRNIFGTPPQSRADYAFIQHIIASMASENGRAAVLLPHGVLNRNEEKEIRKAILQSDCIDAVIGLGRHLFYNSGLESCIVIFRKNKPVAHRSTVLFIEAEKCTHKVQSQNYLFEDDIAKIRSAYFSNIDIPDFSRRVSLDEIMGNDGNLNIKMYVNSDAEVDDGEFADNLDAFVSSSNASHDALRAIDEIAAELPFQDCTVCFDGFDKSKWKRVRLGDVAEEYSERVDDPANSEYEWYIGSDCIDAFAYSISRKEEAKKIHSAQKAFKAGDYLLVRRSLYGSEFRERAPRAEFDGVCSADILTIREKPDQIANGYLIAILYSKQLWKFIVSNSTGSLTRRIKWNQLKDFEFDLPPIPEQENLSELLWAMERTKAAYKNLIARTDELVKSQFIEVIQPLLDSGNTVPLDDLVRDDRPITYGILKPGSGFPGGVPVVKVKDMRDGIIDQSDLLLTTPEIDYQYRRSRLLAGDLLISIRGSVGRMAEVPENLENANITQDTARLTIKPEYNKIYVRGVLESYPLQHDMEKNIRGVAVKGINIGYLRTLGIPVCDRQKQDALAALYQQSDKSKFAAQQALADLTNAQKALMRQYLG